MNVLLNVELWAVVISGAAVAAGAGLIRVCWRRGKRMEDR